MSESAHVLPKHMGGGPHGLGNDLRHFISDVKYIL